MAIADWARELMTALLSLVQCTEEYPHLKGRSCSQGMYLVLGIRITSLDFITTMHATPGLLAIRHRCRS